MKKLIVILVALIAFASFTTFGFAKGGKAKAGVVKGEIVSIDTVKNELTIKSAKTGEQKTIGADATLLSTLKAGDNVKITLKAGETNAAEIVKVVPKVKAKK